MRRLCDGVVNWAVSSAAAADGVTRKRKSQLKRIEEGQDQQQTRQTQHTTMRQHVLRPAEQHYLHHSSSKRFLDLRACAVLVVTRSSHTEEQAKYFNSEDACEVPNKTEEPAYRELQSACFASSIPQASTPM